MIVQEKFVEKLKLYIATKKASADILPQLTPKIINDSFGKNFLLELCSHDAKAQLALSFLLEAKNCFIENSAYLKIVEISCFESKEYRILLEKLIRKFSKCELKEPIRLENITTWDYPDFSLAF